MTNATLVFFGPPGEQPPTGDDGAGRPITLTPDGVTRYEPLGTIDSTGLKEDQ